VLGVYSEALSRVCGAVEEGWRNELDAIDVAGHGRLNK
jgi:hypothetical protein